MIEVATPDVTCAIMDTMSRIPNFADIAFEASRARRSPPAAPSRG